MKTKYPANKKAYTYRINRLTENARDNGFLWRIPPITVMECRMVVYAYYGSRRRALWVMAREDFWLWRRQVVGRSIMWFCDFVGWTKVYDVPETPLMRAHKQRHGRHCSGSPNCNNMNCVDEGCPKWFRKMFFD